MIPDVAFNSVLLPALATSILGCLHARLALQPKNTCRSARSRCACATSPPAAVVALLARLGVALSTHCALIGPPCHAMPPCRRSPATATPGTAAPAASRIWIHATTSSSTAPHSAVTHASQLGTSPPLALTRISELLPGPLQNVNGAGAHCALRSSCTALVQLSAVLRRKTLRQGVPHHKSHRVPAEAQAQQLNHPSWHLLRHQSPPSPVQLRSTTTGRDASSGLARRSSCCTACMSWYYLVHPPWSPPAATAWSTWPAPAWPACRGGPRQGRRRCAAYARRSTCGPAQSPGSRQPPREPAVGGGGHAHAHVHGGRPRRVSRVGAVRAPAGRTQVGR